MNNKELISTNNTRLFIIATLLLFLILLVFFQSNRKPDPAQPKLKNIDQSVELLPIQIDSLGKLIDSFFYRRTTVTFKSENGKFLLKADRFSSDNIEFYNNPELLKITNQGFLIKNLPDNGLEANFQIIRNEGSEYVLVPTDVLFRLFKSKQTARWE